MRSPPRGSTRSTGCVAVLAALVMCAPMVGSSARAEWPEPPPPREGGAGEPLAALLREIERAWTASMGRSFAARASAERRAEELEPGAFESLSFEVVPEVSPGESLRTELAVGVGLGVRVFGVGHRQRDAAARIALGAADELNERLVFAQQAVAGYGEWVAAELQARHLAQHVDEIARDLAPVRSAVEKRQLDALTLETLEVELVRLGLELEAKKSEAADAASSLSVVLGRELDPASFGPVLTEVRSADWREVAVDRHPELARMSAEARRELTTAEVVRRADDPLLTVAATLRRVGEPDESFVFGGVAAALTVPLSRMGGAEAERHAGRAVALREAQRLRATTLTLELAQRDKRHERWLAELERLRAEAEPRLSARVERTASAMRAGRATVSELVLARRDLIELHHAEVTLIGRLVASELLARFWKDALGTGHGDEGGVRR